MQNDQIVQNIVRLAPADMARLPPSIIATKTFFSSKQPCLSAGTTPTLYLSCFTREIVFFISTFSFYAVLRFLWLTTAESRFAQAGK
jgi:hypothetical protein